jgi:hypothetical protein
MSVQIDCCVSFVRWLQKVNPRSGPCQGIVTLDWGMGGEVCDFRGYFFFFCYLLQLGNVQTRRNELTIYGKTMV